MSEKSLVSLQSCSPEADDREVVRRTFETITALGNYGESLGTARTIAMKINAGIHRMTMAHGMPVELTSPAVVEGTIQALRQVTDAEILLGDAPTDGHAFELYDKLGYTERLAKYPRVRLVDFSASELSEVEMTHSSPMMRRYMMPREVVEADAVVSVSKMKAHAAIGFTLCIKNLFGWMPMSVYGTPRLYLHDRLIRLPRVLADIALWSRPSLNVVDGIVAAAKREWGGDVLTPGILLAGTNALATDSTGARVMGFDPEADYPENPFFYRRNPIKLAAEAGLGPIQAADIEVIGAEIEALCTHFEVERYRGNTQRSQQLRRGAACVASYREQQAELAQRYAGRVLSMSNGEVLWDAPDVLTAQKMEYESDRDWQNKPQFMIRCVPVEEEIEDFDWYEIDAAWAAEAAETAA